MEFPFNQCENRATSGDQFTILKLFKKQCLTRALREWVKNDAKRVPYVTQYHRFGLNISKICAGTVASTSFPMCLLTKREDIPREEAK